MIPLDDSEAWARLLHDAPGAFDRARLTETLLFDADLSGSSFRGARLADCVVTGAALTGCDFDGADLTGTDLVLTAAP